MNFIGIWDIKFVITSDIHMFPVYSGEMKLAQSEGNQITGNIELYDGISFYVYSELLSCGFNNRTNKIGFETYVWLANDSISTPAFDYSGTINNANYMWGIFKSGKNKIGNWSATKQ